MDGAASVICELSFCCRLTTACAVVTVVLNSTKLYIMRRAPFINNQLKNMYTKHDFSMT